MLSWSDPLLLVLALATFVAVAWAIVASWRRRQALRWVADLEGQLETQLRDLEGTTSVARHLGTELEARTRALAETRAALLRLSERDGLTGIANRHHFDVACAHEWAVCGRAGVPLAVVLLDLAGLRALNEGVGHLEVDRMLARVALLLEANVPREGDLVARFGGGTFVVLLPATDLAGAELVAQRLTASLDAAPVDHPAWLSGQVTAHLGVVAQVPTREGQASDVVEAALVALARAKAQQAPAVG